MLYSRRYHIRFMTEKKNEKSSGLGSLLLGGVMSSLFGTVHSLFESWQEKTRGLARKLVRHLGLFFFSLVGIIFCLVGAARLLDEFYGRPGLGQVVVGAGILSLTLLLYMFDRNNNNEEVNR